MDYWKALRLYASLNFLYLLGLLAYLALWFHFGMLYDLFLFYFDAPYSDFVLWFPRHHTWLYTIVIGLKISFLACIAGMIWLVFKNRFKLAQLLNFNQRKYYLQFISAEALILFIALAYYLFLYFIAILTLNDPIYGNVQVLIARGFLLQIGFQISTVLFSHGTRSLNYLCNFFLVPQLPYNIAVLRILFFSYLAFLYFAKWNSALEMVGLDSRVALPGIGWLIDILPISPEIYIWVVKIGILSCSLVVLGFKTRFFLVLNAILCFYIFATPNFFGKLWHEQLVIWITWFMALSRCYDVFSIDALLGNTPVEKRSDYTFPIRLVWLQFGIIYFWAGFYKLWDSGFDWALGQSMVNQVQLEWLQNYDQAPSFRIDKWPLLLHIGGMAAILFELSYILLVLRPQLRWIAAIAGLAMHNIIGYFMYISFSMMLQAFYVFYINFNPLFQKRSGASAAPIVNNYSRVALGFGLLIIGFNFFCGMFSIDTYPFSSYPKYSALIPASVDVIRWKAHQKDGTVLDAHQIGKTNDFRWEDYGWLEHNLIRDHLAGINVDKRLNDYWKIWTNRNPELMQFDSVVATIIHRPVSPDGINQIRTKSTFATVRSSSNP